MACAVSTPTGTPPRSWRAEHCVGTGSSPRLHLLRCGPTNQRPPNGDKKPFQEPRRDLVKPSQNDAWSGELQLELERGRPLGERLQGGVGLVIRPPLQVLDPQEVEHVLRGRGRGPPPRGKPGDGRPAPLHAGGTDGSGGGCARPIPCASDGQSAISGCGAVDSGRPRAATKRGSRHNRGPGVSCSTGNFPWRDGRPGFGSHWRSYAPVTLTQRCWAKHVCICTR